MSPFDQNDEFTGSSAEARALRERLKRSAARAEEFEKAAEEDRRLAARQKGQAAEEARVGTAREPGGPLNKGEEAGFEARIRALEKSVALEREQIANQERLAALERNAERRAAGRVAGTAGRGTAAQPSFLPAVQEGRFVPQGPVRPLEAEYLRYRALLGSGGAGAPPPSGPPPVFFRQPEEPERGRPQLPAGPQLKQLGTGNLEFHRDYARAYEEEAKAARVASIESNLFGNSQAKLGPYIEHSGEAMRAANLEFSRFGALSSEWIGAAARGGTTIEELGRQTTATIGKFGGWLAAGALVFGALDAVRAIGKGAIESASGVNQLERVIKTPSSIEPNSLQKSFRQESQHFNLPIEDVTEAAYEMGKVFKTQDEALEASKAVLYSVKVGELDVATASRYLIAIINGFHLPANQLVGVFDMLNQAQNEFGITISDVEAGLAKASGSFNAATTKGSPLQKYHELLALITTAQKATGQTGQVVGTAIQRAPNFLRQQKNKDILKRYGIDAGGDLNDIIVEAFEKSQTLSGHKIAELASAIFGPQYGARIGTPLFQQFDLYKKVLAGTTAKASKGSGETELQTQLGSIAERIAKVKTELESLGSNLAEAGFLNILGVGVETLNQMLQAVNNVLEIFNKLPGPVKDAVSFLIEAKIALAALRHFNAGDTLFGGKNAEAAQRFFNPRNVARNRSNELFIDEESATRNDFAASTRKQRRINRDVPILEEQVARDTERRKAFVNAGLRAGDKELDAAVTAQLNSERQLAVLRERQADEARRQLSLLSELEEIERTKAAVAAATTEAEVERVVASTGRVQPTTVNKGKALTAKEIREQLGVTEEGVIAPPGAVAPNAARATAAAEQSVASARATQASWYSIEALQAKGIAATTVAGQTVARGAGLMKSLGGSLLDMVGGFGGIAFAGLLFAPQIIEGIEGIYRDLASDPTAEAAAEIATQHLTRAQIQQYEKAERARLRKRKEAIARGGEDAATAITEEQYVPEPGFSAYARVYRKLEEAQKQALQERGQAQFLPSDVLEHQLRSVSDLTPGTAHMRKALTDLRHNIQYGDIGDKERKQMLSQLQQLESKNLNASGDITSFYKNFNALANKVAEARLQALGTLVSAGPAFSTRKDVHQFVDRGITNALRDFGSGKAAIREKGVGQVEEVIQALESNTQNELQQNLALARTQEERNKAYKTFFHRQRENTKVLRDRLNARKGQAEEKLTETEGTLHQLYAEGKGIAPTGAEAKHHGFSGTASSDQDIKNIEDLRQRRDQLRHTLVEVGKSQEYIRRKVEAFTREQGQALLTERLGVIGEQSQIKEARIGGEHPVAQAQAGLAAAKRELALVKNSKVASPEQERQAILALLQAREAVRQAVKQSAEGLASAAEALAQAEANGDPILEAQAELTKAQGDLARAKNTEQRDNALAEVINARHKLEADEAEIVISGIELEAAKSQNPVTVARDAIRIAKEKLATAHGAAARNSALKELVEARQAYEETQTAIALSVVELDAASTEDPVRQARDKLKAANINLKASRGKGQAAENKAEAERREAARGVRESVARRAIENVEFDVAIGRLTVDQEIAAYTRLLHTLKLGRDAKRNLIEKIHSLQEEASGSLELTVGNIALPTLYDIKRAVQGGIGGGTPQAGSYNDYSSQTNVVHIHGDQREIERALDNTINRNTKTSKKSAGV